MTGTMRPWRPSWLPLRDCSGEKCSGNQVIRKSVVSNSTPPSSMGNAQEMVRQAKLLAEATSSLINAIKREAEAETDPDARKKLLDAAKSLADATAFMVEAAKVAARNPQDGKAQENLRRAAEHLRSVQ